MTRRLIRPPYVCSCGEVIRLPFSAEVWVVCPACGIDSATDPLETTAPRLAPDPSLLPDPWETAAADDPPAWEMQAFRDAQRAARDPRRMEELRREWWQQPATDAQAARRDARPEPIRWWQTAFSQSVYDQWQATLAEARARARPATIQRQIQRQAEPQHREPDRRRPGGWSTSRAWRPPPEEAT